MPSQNVIVKNKLGIHARPAAQFVKTASNYSCDIRVEKDEEEVDGKSIMGLMMLAAGYESQLVITTEGDDEADALQALVSLIESNFDEN